MPKWSPDGSRIALECNGLCIADLNGKIERVYDLPRKYPDPDPLVFIISIAWSHDGQSVYLGARWAGILRYDTKTGETVPILFSDFTEFYDLSNRPEP